jgi:hypothetical protein
MFKRRAIPPDRNAPTQLIEIAQELAQLASVSVPKFVSKPFLEECEPPIWCQVPGEVWVYEPDLADYNEHEIRWLIAHAICTNEHDPPKSLAEIEVNGTLVLLAWIFVLPLVVLTTLWITAIWVFISLLFSYDYFSRVGRIQKARVKKALELAKQVTGDLDSEATVLEKQYKRWGVKPD